MKPKKVLLLAALLSAFVVRGQWNPSGNSYSTGGIGLGTTSLAEYDFEIVRSNSKAGISVLNSSLTGRSLLLLGQSSANGKYGYLGHLSSSFNAGTGYTQSYKPSSTVLVAGDANGLGIIANNEIRFYSGGSEDAKQRMVIDNQGNVGIGTVAPKAKFHISGGHMVFEVPNSSPTIYTSTAENNDNPRFLSLINSPTHTSAAGLKAGGILVSDLYSFASPDRNTLVVKGKVGVTVASPLTKLDLGDLRFDAISAFPAEGAISESIWSNYIIGSTNTANILQQLRIGVANDLYTRAEILIDNGNRSDGTIALKTTAGGGGAQTRFFVHGGGNVGIGTGTNLPVTKLEVNGTLKAYQQLHLGENYSSADRGITVDNGASTAWTLLKLKNNNGNLFTVFGNGNVGIGTGAATPDHKLDVGGVVHAEEVIVDLNVPGPDYVFDDAYSLQTLEETEAYIKINKHLPEIPSAKEMEAEGIKLKEMNMLLLKKIEELTLHLIDEHKKNAEHKQQIEEQKELLNEQTQQIEEQKELLNAVLLRIEKLESK